MGHGAEYRYAHDEPEYAAGVIISETLAGTRLYEPVNRGLEIKIGERLAHPTNRINHDDDLCGGAIGGAGCLCSIRFKHRFQRHRSHLDCQWISCFNRCVGRFWLAEQS